MGSHYTITRRIEGNIWLIMTIPKSISEAKAIYEETMAKKKEPQKAEAAKRRLIYKAKKAKRAALYKLEREEQIEHDNYIYSRKPATELVDTIIRSLEDPSNSASNLVCDHIAKQEKMIIFMFMVWIPVVMMECAILMMQ